VPMSCGQCRLLPVGEASLDAGSAGGTLAVLPMR
jgi:hypothetical protein